MLLGDLGADVVKVEPARGGDDTRAWGPPFSRGGETAYFLALNRNKRSIAVDLRAPLGRALVRRLAARSDVLLENFVPGKAEALGLDYETLRLENPRLVYAAISGFGSSGPYSRHRAYDVMISALGGLMHATGPPSAPAKVGVAITDVCAGLFMQGAILAALLHRERTGEGQKVETSLLEAQIAALVNIGSNYLVGGEDARRWGTAHASIAPYQAFACADGASVVVGALNDVQFARLARALGRPELAHDARFRTNADRVAHRQEVVGAVAAVLAGHSREHWLALLRDAGVPCAPVNNMAEVFADPQVVHSGIVKRVSHPTAGEVALVGPPVAYSRTPASVRSAPPLLGEHTVEILREVLGLDDAEIAHLRKEGVVVAAETRERQEDAPPG